MSLQNSSMSSLSPFFPISHFHKLIFFPAYSHVWFKLIAGQMTQYPHVIKQFSQTYKNCKDKILVFAP